MRGGRLCSGGGCTLSAIGGWRGGGGVDALGGGLGHGRVAPRGVRATAATLLVGRARGRSGGRVVAVFVLPCVDVRAGWLYRCDSLFSFLDACRSVTRFHTPAPARTPDVATNTHSFEHRPHALLKAPPAPPMYTSPAGSTLLPYTRAHHKRALRASVRQRLVAHPMHKGHGRIPPPPPPPIPPAPPARASVSGLRPCQTSCWRKTRPPWPSPH